MKSKISEIKYVNYCRKSSEEKNRQLLSIPAQEKWGEEIKKFWKIKVLEVLIEEKSAKMPYQRAIFDTMVHQIKNAKWQGIITWKLDRLARNPEEAGIILGMLKRGEIMHIITSEREYRPEDNALISYVDFGMADQFVRDLSRNVMRGLKQKVEMGWLPGVAKPGYRNTPHREKGARKILVDRKRFTLLRQAIEIILTGNHTPFQVLNVLNNEWGYRTLIRNKLGGKPLAQSSFYRILSDPFNYGWYEYPQGSGEWHKGKHETLITKEEFDQIQFLLGKKGKRQPKTREFAYTGLITCGECHSAITAEEKNQLICTNCKHKFPYENKLECPKCEMKIVKMEEPTMLHYVYYHCTKKKNRRCSQKSIKVEKLEEQIDKELEALEIDEHHLEGALNYFDEKKAQEVKNKTTITKSLQDAHNTIQVQIDRLEIEYMSPQNADYSLFTSERFKELKLKLMREKSKIEEKMKDPKANVEIWLEPSKRTFKLCAYGRYHHLIGDKNTKRAIVSSLGSNLTLVDKKLNIQAEKPYLIIKRTRPGGNDKKDGLEPEINGFNKRKKNGFHHFNSFPVPGVGGC